MFTQFHFSIANLSFILVIANSLSFLQIYYDFSLPIVNSLSWSRILLINCICREFIIHLYILIKIYSYRICYRLNSRIDFYLTFLWPQMTFEQPFIFCLTLNSYSPFSFVSNSTQNLCIMLSIHDLTYIRPQNDLEWPLETVCYSIWPRMTFLHRNLFNLTPKWVSPSNLTSKYMYNAGIMVSIHYLIFTWP